MFASTPGFHDHAHFTSPAKSPPPGERPHPPAPPPPPWWRAWLLPIGVGLTLWLLLSPALLSGATTLTYTDFVTKVDAGNVKTAEINADGQVTGTLANGDAYLTAIPTAVPDNRLARSLSQHDVEVTAVPPRAGLLDYLLLFGPLLLIIGLFAWAGRRAQGQLASLGGFGRARAKVVDAERPTTRFTDVAGYEGAKQEVTEVVDFLKAPDRYRRAGARGPRGVLMVGPPGTGKTLLARAVAGEADVPFLSVTGSAFVEMFVGVGAARVRDLFADARRRAPAIVFIDEIDALGQRRGGIAPVSNDEREQTLNQLLAEMDGFEPGEGIVVLAATNRPEALDAALLRPGRFDRQVVVPLPTQSERRAILAVHAADKVLDTDVDLDVVARGTPGFSGADLANLVNEAAIAAVRKGREVLSAADFDMARDRILLGRREGSNVLLPEEKRTVAVHESGHALVAALCPEADPVAKVTILPAGMALGVTEQLPLDERHLYSERYLHDLLAVRLGGRAAELIVNGEGSTGAANDLAGATEVATKMVREYGLSDEIGPVGYGGEGPLYLGTEPVRPRQYAEATQRLVDQQVTALLRAAQQRAVDLLRGHRRELDALVRLLLERETVDGSAVYGLLGRPGPTRAAGEAPVTVQPSGVGDR